MWDLGVSFCTVIVKTQAPSVYSYQYFISRLRYPLPENRVFRLLMIFRASENAKDFLSPLFLTLEPPQLLKMNQEQKTTSIAVFVSSPSLEPREM